MYPHNTYEYYNNNNNSVKENNIVPLLEDIFQMKILFFQ